MISVILPTYNRAATLKRAVDSVLNQTYSDIELIVVDDCSTDDTEKIIDGYDDNRLQYVKLKKNSGACVARNIGIKKANGEYIAFQDSDDFWEKEKLEVQLKSLEESGMNLSFCRIEVYDGEYPGILRPNNKEIRRVESRGLQSALCNGNFISTQAILGEAKCFKECRFDENLPRLQDFDICLRLAGKFSWSFCDRQLVKLYVQEDSVSRNNAKMIKAVDIIAKKDYQLEEADSHRLRAHLYEDIGNIFVATKDYKSAKIYYKKSLREKMNLKVACKRVLICGRGR